MESMLQGLVIALHLFMLACHHCSRKERMRRSCLAPHLRKSRVKMATKRVKKKKKKDEANPESEERHRLKRLAFSNGIISKTPAKASRHINPSNTVLNHTGKDIVKKSHRRNKYLFSFPAHLAPIGCGGKIGDLTDLGTKNPLLYVHFPQGRMKLFGTILYPKNRYLTLQFSRDGKNALCEDYFDNMIVFSDAWWIGRKDENPEETRLDFPKEMYKGQQTDYEFMGGAGASSVVTQRAAKSKMQHAKKKPETPDENDMSESSNTSKDSKEAIPGHHSDRPAERTYRFAKVSSGLNNPDVSIRKEVVEAKFAMTDHNNLKKENPYALEVDNDQWKALEVTPLLQKKRKYASMFANRASLVHASMASLFTKVEDEVENDDDIEEFSSASKETDGSDEDWAL